MPRRKRVIITAVIAAVSSGLLALSMTRNSITASVVAELTPILSVVPIPDLSFLESFGVNMSFGELVVLAAAAFLFLFIGFGLGRTAHAQPKQVQQQPRPPPAKSAVKSAQAKPLKASPTAEPIGPLSAEERLSRLLHHEDNQS